MAFVDCSDLRTRFATAIKTLSGFTESRNPFDDFNRNPNAVAQKRFSVGIGRGEALEEQRENASVGILCDTRILVKFPYRLRPKDQVLDYGLSMDSVQLVIAKCTTRAAPLHTGLQIFFRGFDHEVTESGEYIISTLEFSVLHQISII
mgnify:CR=1 FL=1